ncbi:MAG: 50S ribosomal protein L19 [Patescibacteria group bacterium]|nr:50S ribosomal protein L19 [Patescibacteria group bacterium]MDD4304128.1 50S ribosomal protein L19 [Patescibacteria group bacterium]MDD4695159.1 50S ribosomal protein L19 [Patescibacteria group bacterium]
MTKEIKNQGTKKQGKSDKGNIILKDVKFEIESGMVVRVHEKIREKNAKGEEKERIQIFEGIVIAHKHGKEIGSTVTVRKDSNGIGVEKVFPLNSPLIDKIELKSRIKSSKSKLYYLRDYKKRLKKVSI